MVGLALHYGNGPSFLKDVAKAEEIPQKYLTQLVIPLKAKGLLSATRGAHGGYALARHPKEITLKEIVEVLEGDLMPIDCSKNVHECRRVSLCVTRDVWAQVSAKIAQTLKAITLEDLVRKYRKKGKRSAMRHL